MIWQRAACLAVVLILNCHTGWAGEYEDAQAVMSKHRGDLAGALAEVTKKTNEPTSRHVQRGVCYMLAGDFSRGLQEMKAALAIDSHYAPALILASQCAKQLQDTRYALSLVERVPADSEHYSFSLLNKAVLLHDQKRDKEALTAIDASLKTANNPKMTSLALTTKARLLTEMNRNTDALKVLNSVPLDPNDVEMLDARATIALRLGRLDDAIAYCNKAASIKATTLTFMNRAKAWQAKDKRTLAISDLENASKLTQDVTTLLSIGCSLRDLGERRKAVDVLSAGLRMAVDSTSKFIGHYFRGVCEYELGRSGPAIADLTVALKLRPEFADALLFLGLSEGLAGKSQLAESHLKTVLSRDPNCVPGLLELSKLESARGDLDAALGHIQSAVAVEPNNRTLIAVLQDINEKRELMEHDKNYLDRELERARRRNNAHRH